MVGIKKLKCVLIVKCTECFIEGHAMLLQIKFTFSESHSNFKVAIHTLYV